MDSVNNLVEPVFKHEGFKIYEQIFEEPEMISFTLKEPLSTCNTCHLPATNIDLKMQKASNYFNCIRCAVIFCDVFCTNLHESLYDDGCKWYDLRFGGKTDIIRDWKNKIRFQFLVNLKNNRDKIFNSRANIMGNDYSFKDLNPHPNGIVIDVLKRMEIDGKNACDYFELDLFDVSRVFSNGITFYDLQPEVNGIAFNMNLTIFKHSCKPNAVAVKKGNLIRIVALKDIAPNEPITIAKYNMFLPCYVRRDLVEQFTGSPCSCNECNNNQLNLNDYRLRNEKYDLKYKTKDEEISVLNDDYKVFVNYDVNESGPYNLFVLTNNIIDRFERLFPYPHPLKVFILIKSFKFIYKFKRSQQLDNYYKKFIWYMLHSINLLYGYDNTVIYHFVNLFSEEDFKNLFNVSRLSFPHGYVIPLYTKHDSHLLSIEGFLENVPHKSVLIAFEDTERDEDDVYPFPPASVKLRKVRTFIRDNVRSSRTS